VADFALQVHDLCRLGRNFLTGKYVLRIEPQAVRTKPHAVRTKPHAVRTKTHAVRPPATDRLQQSVQFLAMIQPELCLISRV
jgi:hypothetical protein